MSNEIKDVLDIGALTAIVTNFFNDFIDFWPHLITGISAVLGMLWIGLGVVQRLKELGWLKGRTKRTRERYDDNEL